MKPLIIGIIVVALFVGGLGGGYLYLNRSTDAETATKTNAAVIENAVSEHGKRVEIPENATLCAEHRIPDVVCPFCTPALIEELGFCGGHDVAEALCTRCQPALIAAFKAEGDWCSEHGLPESQCKVCASG